MLEYILDLIFPPKCIFCDSILGDDSICGACKKCYEKIPFSGRLSLSYGSIKQQTYYDQVVCVCEYEGIIKKALVKYKFSNRPSFYRTFARLMHVSLKNMTNCRNFDIIMSVPLHKARERDRGYNQAQLISKALAKEMGMGDKSWLLSRVRNTGNQSLLAQKQRLVNIKDAFKVTDINKVRGKSILLIDDVLTTGATVNECSRVLKEAGALDITVGVIASGRKY